MLIRKPTSHACRCRRCEARRRLPKHPDEYVRPPRCRNCGARTWRVDRYRDDGREQRGHTCRCEGYSFPHFRGRGYCLSNLALTADMMQARYENRAWA